jgi:lambda family phage minor tail protein L
VSAPIPEQLISPAPGAIVELFAIDLSPISAGAATLLITPEGKPYNSAETLTTQILGLTSLIDVTPGTHNSFKLEAPVTIMQSNGIPFATRVRMISPLSDQIVTYDALTVGADLGAAVVQPGGVLPVARDGLIYQPFPVAAEGFERGGTGALPTPTLTVANVAQTLSAWVEGAQDLIGAEVTRTVVLFDWLDGESAADPAAAISVDTYVISQKSHQDKNRISFQLRSPIDVRRQVPFRKAYPRCSHTYRRYVAGAFVRGSCPYTGAGTFDYYDAVTALPGDDVCRRKLSSCKIRFGATASLPLRGFPGLK